MGAYVSHHSRRNGRARPRSSTRLREPLGESFHLIPVGVNMIARGIGTQATWLVAHNLLHHEAFEEPVLAIEQGTAEETNLRWTPACLLLEVLNISASVLEVTMCGKAHREER